MTATWERIKAHLQASGYMDENGVTRRVRAVTCRRCHAPILTGLSADVAAHTAEVDPAPISPLGEALAVLAGRRTYTLRHLGGKWVVTPRSSFAIAGTPAGTGRHDTLAAHRCGTPPLPSAPSVYAARAAGDYPKGTPCPF